MNATRFRARLAKGGDLRVSRNVDRSQDAIMLDGEESAVKADGAPEWTLSFLNASACRVNGLPHERLDVARSHRIS
jgi:hypothetical protein